MRIGDQQIDEAIIARMQRTIDEHPGLSRTAASRRICEELKLRSQNGRLKEVNCRTALLKLQRAGALRLPEARPFGGRPRVRKSPARVARLAVRFVPVTLKAPKIKSRYGPLKLWAVLAEEVDSPGGVEPLSRMLLTSCPVQNVEDAVEKID